MASMAIFSNKQAEVSTFYSICNAIPSSTGYGKHRVDAFDLNAHVNNVMSQSVAAP